MATGGELPPDKLTRISHAEASVHVGVAEFADDAPLAAALLPEARSPPLAVCGRRAALGQDWPCSAEGRDVNDGAQSPAATSLRLQPHEADLPPPSAPPAIRASLLRSS